MNLFQELDIDLERVNSEIKRAFLEDEDLKDQDFIKESIVEIINSGGKRLRPLFVVVSARFGPKYKRNEEKVYQVAAVSEIVHLSSLIHDDIIDNSDLRRGIETLHRKKDVLTATFVGNYVVNRVGEVLSEKENEEVHEHFFNTLHGMCLGEISQIRQKFDFELTLDEYLEKTNRKTASLITACFKAGAYGSGADEKNAELLSEFGYYVGMSFQIIDDILDFTQSDEVLGKPAGNDLISGNITLPVIYALEGDLRDEILSLNKDSEISEFKAVIDKIKKSDAIDRAYAFCFDYTRRANEIIHQLQCSKKHKNDLRKILEYLSERIY